MRVSGTTTHPGRAVRPCNSPRGSKYPIFEDSGSKNHTLNGFWDQSPSITSIWTLWVCIRTDKVLLRRFFCLLARPGRDSAVLDEMGEMGCLPKPPHVSLFRVAGIYRTTGTSQE